MPAIFMRFLRELCFFESRAGMMARRSILTLQSEAITGLYSCQQRVERIDSDPMLDGRSAKPVDAESARKGVKCVRILRGGCTPGTALGLLGLAFAIALWAFSYKLSRFDFSHADTLAHVPAPRLWIEQRFGIAGIAGAARVTPSKPRIHAQPGADALIANSPEFVFDCAPAMPALAARPRAIPFFQTAIPLRSPPVVSL
jgi:hypothetical protein